MKPLAERLRPTTLDGYIGQKHLVGEGAVLRKMIESGNLASFILWGPPGVGKTTLAQIIASQSGRSFYSLSAVSSSVKDVRDVIESAEKNKLFNPKAPILFIDEIHRFSKSQQDSLLAAVEKGTFVLIGATTENPSFEVISPLLSRCRVYVLKPLEESDLKQLINTALTEDSELKDKKVEIVELDALLLYSGGDARKLLSALELVLSTEEGEIKLTNELVKSKLQANLLAYDKQGEMHYDIISAFIKSIRGSDANAAIYWLARMIDGGEDPKFIAQLYLLSASELLWIRAKQVMCSPGFIDYSCLDLKLTEPNAYLYFCTAMDIQYGGSHIDLYELTLDEIVDFDAFRVICNSVAICLYGMDAVKVAEKRKRYKKKKKAKVVNDERN